MNVKVESCWNGQRTFYTMTLPNNVRERVYSDKWDKETAKEALDICEKVYKMNRRNVRFIHK